MRTIMNESWDEVEIPDELCEFELEYDDLDIPVEQEYVEYTNKYGPMNDYGDTGEVDGTNYGTIRSWTYTVEPDLGDFEGFLKKDAKDITQADINSIDADAFKEYLTEYYEDSAIEDAKENYEDDDVDWSEPDYSDDYDESLEEGKKRKKKDCSSVTYTTGDIGYNIDQFNKRMGTDNSNPSTEEAKEAARQANSAVTSETASSGETSSSGAETGSNGDAASSSEGGAMGEGLNMDKKLEEDKVFSPKAKMYIELPEHIKLLDKHTVSEFIAELQPEERFTVGYATPIYFYKKLLDKFTLVKCTEFTGYTGVDFRAADVTKFEKDTAVIGQATSQIDNPEGETDYGDRFNKENNMVKSNISGMRKNYDQVNKTVQQSNQFLYQYDENGKLLKDENGKPIVTETITDMNTILFYPVPGSKANISYFIDFHDGDGYFECTREDLQETVYSRLYDVLKKDRSELFRKKDKSDEEKDELKELMDNVAAKITATLENDAKTIQGQVMSLGDTVNGEHNKPSVRALYTGQIYFLVAKGKQPIGTSLYESLNESVKLDEAKRYVRRYYLKPQNIFCSNKSDIIKALIDIDDQDCTIYTLNNLGDEKDVTKLTPNDIIYYYNDEILYDKNHIKVMDYDLYIKHEENRDKINANTVSDAKFNDVYDDRITSADLDDTEVTESKEPLNESSLTLDQKQFEDGYYIECRWDKYAGYEVLAGDEINGTVHDDYHISYPTKEAALRAYKRLCAKHDSEINEDYVYADDTIVPMESSEPEYEPWEADWHNEDIYVTSNGYGALYVGDDETKAMEALKDASEEYKAGTLKAYDGCITVFGGEFNQRTHNDVNKLNDFDPKNTDETHRLAFNSVLSELIDDFVTVAEIDCLTDDEREAEYEREVDDSIICDEAFDLSFEPVNAFGERLHENKLTERDAVSVWPDDDDNDPFTDDWDELCKKIEAVVGYDIEEPINAPDNKWYIKSRDYDENKDRYSWDGYSTYVFAYRPNPDPEEYDAAFMDSIKYGQIEKLIEEDDCEVTEDGDDGVIYIIAKKEGHTEADFESLHEDKNSGERCCICGEPIESYGNNPEPYKHEGKCCDACNIKFVIPARLAQDQDEDKAEEK